MVINMYKRIRDLRESKNYTQQQLADYLNVSQTTYSRYENGVLDIPSNVLKKLASFYQVTIDFILEIEI